MTEIVTELQHQNMRLNHEVREIRQSLDKIVSK
jgi:hypothetical protein